MPTKATESVVLALGTLVMTKNQVCSLPSQQRLPGGHPVSDMSDKVIVEAGTVGVIIQRPDTIRPRQFLVQFVGNETYWMYSGEVTPYKGAIDV
tara:strand:- start:1652 stop:1933 length:282 start_codon:yes stop_codon:yes gene_type:complete